jgi:hypothetical protein
MIAFCYYRSVGVKVMTLLMLPAADISLTWRLAAAVLCRSAGWKLMTVETATANGFAIVYSTCSSY